MIAIPDRLADVLVLINCYLGAQRPVELAGEHVGQNASYLRHCSSYLRAVLMGQMNFKPSIDCIAQLSGWPICFWDNGWAVGLV